MSRNTPTEDELHAFVDDQLDRDRARDVQAYLASHPDERARVAAYRRNAEELRALLAGASLLPPSPRLDPLAIRRDLRQRSRRRAMLCASLVVALGLGGLGGWKARSMSLIGLPPPMEDALVAYRTFATDRERPVEMTAGEGIDLQAWLSVRLGRPVALPDLAPFGFDLLGVRLLATADGAAVLLMYEDRGGQRVSFYIRPTRPLFELTGTRRDGGLATKYWFRDGYGFAVVGRADDPRLREVQEAARLSM
ncbi:anti-sigma factor family protein [Sorangium sp. So ce861]|uniref:anti-sigma factor family protein n=1 Tax=Sorangium sp. So ce861 TaxID=3133323 RepID=UPI003F5E9D8C